jgi:hypothetical protein
MDTLAPRIEKNVMRGALRAGMNVVKPMAVANARKSSGVYASGLKVGTRARGGRVTASLKATGPHAYLGRWIEFGTRAHNIAAKVNGWLSFGGIFTKSVAHPGARPFPHMRPALDANATAAVQASAEYMRTRLATKHGLDTSGVVLEGDE